jgi:orotidine-5'-phosphate decarboxylase
MTNNGLVQPTWLEKKEHRIIVPLDVSTFTEAVAWLDRLPQVRFWKVGLELFVSTGGDIVGELQKREKRIFLDLKFHDIPNTMAGACRAAARYGVDLLTVHATAGRRALKAATEAVESAAITSQTPATKLLGVTLLTSVNSRDLAFDLKVPVELSEYVLQMAVLSWESGLAGVVCSAKEAAHLRRVCGNDFILVCPGIRPAWAERRDQQRAMTPTEAFAAGADYLVIGRPITEAKNPEDAWQRICAEIP